MISTHVLDTSLGVPAEGVSVELFKKIGSEFKSVETLQTNADGRGVFQAALDRGTYRLLFVTQAYWLKRKIKGFFPEVSVVFDVSDSEKQKLHVPLLLSPYGYSTYRGS